MKMLMWIARILTGALFIFSGLIKANDPVGFSIKLEEYFHVFGMEFMAPLALTLAILLTALEVFLGIALILGAFVRQVSWLLLLLILFFTWLTAYSAITGKVTDCGCFGDAIKLTPWESFYKDLVLLVFIVFLFLVRRQVRPVFKAFRGEWLSGAIGVLTLLFSLHCYYHLPLIDFRAYKVGNNILQGMEIPEGAPLDEYELIYTLKNIETGELRDFVNSLPDDYGTVWEYVSRADKLVKKGYQPPIKDFRAQDADGNDYTGDLLEVPQPILIFLSPDLSQAGLKGVERFRTLARDAQELGWLVYGLTSSNPVYTESFRHEHQLAIPFFFMDETVIKTIIRANPGAMVLHQGTVMGKWNFRDFPDKKALESLIL